MTTAPRFPAIDFLDDRFLFLFHRSFRREVAISQLLNQSAAIGFPEHSIPAHIIPAKREGL